MNIFPTTVIVTFLFVLSISTSTSVSSSEHCETLKTKLSYKQENAPKDISAVVRDIVVSNLKKKKYIYIYFFFTGFCIILNLSHMNSPHISQFHMI